MNSELQMPHNHDAERALLGSILFDNSALNAIAGAVSMEDFFADSHRLIFERIVKLRDKGVMVDVVTLAEELTRSGQLDKAGGVAYLAGLSDGVPMGDYSFVGNYARIVKQKSILRQLATGASLVMSRASNASEDPTEILADASGIINAIQEQTQAVSRAAVSIAQVISETIPQLDHASAGKMSGLPTGFPSLDRLTAGWQQSEYVVVAARPSVGKTAFAL